MKTAYAMGTLLFLFQVHLPVLLRAEPLEFVRLAPDHLSFVSGESGEPFKPNGFNYDHDENGILLEDYWTENWKKVTEDFQEMKKLGAQVVRVHLQVSQLMLGIKEVNPQSFERFSRLIRLAEETGIYLNVTGLGCYHKRDVPVWYDSLSREERWEVQARFWQAIAERGANSPAIFCYDLMNEPVVAGGKEPRTDWLGGEFAGKYFVQFINLKLPDRTSREDMAMQWVRKLKSAIRRHDQNHLITVGLIGSPRNKKGEYFHGLPVNEIARELDFISVHIYPEKDNLKKSLKTLIDYQYGKPVVVEEIFPLKCPADQLKTFIQQAEHHHLVNGWIGFYWGKQPEEYRGSKKQNDILTLKWLELFQSDIASRSD